MKSLRDITLFSHPASYLMKVRCVWVSIFHATLLQTAARRRTEGEEVFNLSICSFVRQARKKLYNTGGTLSGGTTCQK